MQKEEEKDIIEEVTKDDTKLSDKNSNLDKSLNPTQHQIDT